MVERFFREITTKQLRRGVLRSLEELLAAIQDYITHYNQRPTPFVWTAKASDILAKVSRARASIEPPRTSGEAAVTLRNRARVRKNARVRLHQFSRGCGMVSGKLRDLFHTPWNGVNPPHGGGERPRRRR